MFTDYADMMDFYGADYDMNFNLPLDDELLLDDDYYDDSYDEIGYNPYLGGYDYDC